MGVAVFNMILESAVICVVTWTLWKYFRQMFVKNHLDNIPGPPCPSWVTGECDFSIPFAISIALLAGFSTVKSWMLTGCLC